MKQNPCQWRRMRLNDRPAITQTLSNIPDGKAGIVATLKIMRALVKKSKTSLPVRSLALDIVAHLPPKAYGQEAASVHDWVRDNIRFVRDVTDVETLHDAERVLEFGQGDCDDKSILYCSLMESIGHPTRFCAVGFAPDDYEHVYSETRIGQRWVPSDTTEMRPFGWRPPGTLSSLIIHN